MNFDWYTRTPRLPPEVKKMKDPWDVPRSRLSPFKEFVAAALFALSFLTAAGLVVHGAGTGRLWLIVPAFALGIGTWLVGSRLYVRAVYRQIARDATRIAALEQLGMSSGTSCIFKGNAPIAWPLFFTAISFVFALVAWFWRDPILALLTILILIPAALVGWMIALRRRGVLLELSAAGVRIAGHELPWRQVANMRMLTHYRDPSPHLYIDLNEPLPARGWTTRAISFLSRGASDREVSVSLRYAAEPAAVIFKISRDYWKSMVGSDIPLAAAGRQIAQYRRDLRKFSERTAGEKVQGVAVILSLFGVMAWCWHGALVSFWISPAWLAPSGWISAVFTAGGLLWLLRHRRLASLRNRQGPAMYLLMFLFVVAMLTCVSWVIIGRSIPDVVTRLAGTRHESVVEMRKAVKTASRGCSRRISNEEMERRFPSAYCADAAEFARLPASGRMRVISRESWFGKHIERIEPLEAAP